MKKDLSNKNILFIAPIFFNYHLDIIEELRNRGAKVDFIADRPFKSNILKSINRYFRPILSYYSNIFYKRKFKYFLYENFSHYDIVFVIIGESLTPKILEFIKKYNPDSIFILYMWDALKNKPHIKKNFNLFNNIFSFDPIDSSIYNLNFRPLFYSNKFSSHNNLSANDNSIDISFIGTGHSDRFNIIKNIQQHIPKNYRSYFYLYLQAKWVYLFRKILDNNFKDAKLENFNFVPLSKKDTSDIFLSSKIILDIEHPKQSGLTMRTFEALGARKKLITTNHNIIKYDFYHPNNIFIIDRDNINIDLDFFEKPYIDIDNELMNKYSLSEWINEILEKSKLLKYS